MTWISHPIRWNATKKEWNKARNTTPQNEITTIDTKKLNLVWNMRTYIYTPASTLFYIWKLGNIWEQYNLQMAMTPGSWTPHIPRPICQVTLDDTFVVLAGTGLVPCGTRRTATHTWIASIPLVMFIGICMDLFWHLAETSWSQSYSSIYVCKGHGSGQLQNDIHLWIGLSHICKDTAGKPWFIHGLFLYRHADSMNKRRDMKYVHYIHIQYSAHTYTHEIRRIYFIDCTYTNL